MESVIKNSLLKVAIPLTKRTISSAREAIFVKIKAVLSDFLLYLWFAFMFLIFFITVTI